MTKKIPNGVRKHRESTQLNSSKTVKLFFMEREMRQNSIVPFNVAMFRNRGDLQKSWRCLESWQCLEIVAMFRNHGDL